MSMLEKEGYIKLMNAVRKDIILFIKASFDSGVSKQEWANVILSNELVYGIKDIKPDAPATSGKDLLIIGVFGKVAYDNPYIQVGNFIMNVNDWISKDATFEAGEYEDDNGDVKKGVIVGNTVSGQVVLNVGAFSQEERNKLLEWLYIYFMIGRKILETGNTALGIDGNIGVGQFKISVSDTGTKIIHDRYLWKGSMSLQATGFWQIFIPLEGLYNGIDVEGNNFLQIIKENVFYS